MKKSSVFQHRGYYSLVRDAFALLDIEDSKNGKMKPRMPNDAVEISRFAG